MSSSLEPQGLFPEEILHGLRGVPFLSDADLAAATGVFIGGVTNQSWGVVTGNRRCVVRVPRPGTPRVLDREAEAHNTRSMSDLGINVPTLFMSSATGLKISPWLDGATLEAPDLRNRAVLIEICDLLRRVHRSGAELQPSFRPTRLFEDIEAALGFLPPEMASVRQDFDTCRARFSSYGVRAVACHQDLYRSNFFRSAGRLYLIDWEHSGPNDPIYDLADLSVQGDLTPDEDRILLETYFAGTSEPLPRERFWCAQQLSRLVWGVWALARAAHDAGDPAHLMAGRGKLMAAREALRRGF